MMPDITGAARLSLNNSLPRRTESSSIYVKTLHLPGETTFSSR